MAVLLAGLAGAAYAGPLMIDNVTARDAAGQIASHYGVGVVLRGHLNPLAMVSVDVSDADTAGGRLSAINALADALGADFQKTIVVSHMAVDEPVPSPKLDVSSPVYFGSTTLPVQDAINLVASVDDASTQYFGDISGSVKLTSAQLNAQEAATQIAQQTHTRWKAFYVIAPRGEGLQDGTVVGRTALGQPIIEYGYTRFVSPQVNSPSVPEKTPDQTAQAQPQANAAGTTTGQPAAAGQQTAAAAPGATPSPYDYAYGYPGYGYGAYSPYGYGYSPYTGYSPYGYSPYGYSGYGANPYGTGYGYSGYGDQSAYQAAPGVSFNPIGGSVNGGNIAPGLSLQGGGPMGAMPGYEYYFP